MNPSTYKIYIIKYAILRGIMYHGIDFNEIPEDIIHYIYMLKTNLESIEKYIECIKIFKQKIYSFRVVYYCNAEIYHRPIRGTVTYYQFIKHFPFLFYRTLVERSKGAYYRIAIDLGDGFWKMSEKNCFDQNFSYIITSTGMYEQWARPKHLSDREWLLLFVQTTFKIFPRSEEHTSELQSR